MSDLYLYEDIEYGHAVQFVAGLNKIDGDEITIHVNSYGGDVFEGLTMMHSLRSHPATVTAIVEGVAASAASFIVVGGADRVVMREGTRMMVHNALSASIGNADDMDKVSAQLRKTSADIAAIYAQRAGSEVAEWQAAMDSETWFTAEEAVAAGLADAVESGRVEREPVLAASGSRMMNKFRGRRGSPPASLLNHPEGGERGDGMSLSKEDIVAIIRDEFQKIKNEAVSISGEVEVTYPSDVKIVPTEKIKVEPVIGDKPAESAEGEDAAPVDPSVGNAEDAGESAAVQLAKQAGLTFTMGDVAEGFTAEVDEGGVVTITAPSGAEVGSTAAFTVMVNDTAVALSVTVRSLSDDDGEEDSPADDGGEPDAAPVPADDVVPVPRAHFEWMNKMAARFGEAQEKADEQEKVDRVERDIAAGRFAVSNKAQALAAIKRDQDAYEASWGQLPKNTIPRGEVGYGRDSVDDDDPVATARRQKPNPFPKPKF